MAWIPLADRLSTMPLPLVIAGPILRKVTESSVTVWLALSEQADVTLEIRDLEEQVANSLFSAQRPTVRIGPKLHLVAVTARCGNKPPLSAGTIYYYDVSFTTKNGKEYPLSEAVGASGEVAYTYTGKRLPSFALPPENLIDVRLIQGSCRKPHADGPDALAMLDDIIEASIDSPLGRPHQLLLTGDQIYADDVADVLLLMLTDAASTLLVDPEPLPRPDNSESLAKMLPPTTRSDVILKEARLTTQESRSHLMSFGEYMAMYLFVWSDVLWPVTTTSGTDRNIPIFIDLYKALSKTPGAQARLPGLVDSIKTQLSGVEQFQSTVLKVRRALANVPTAMILDDHEITDDWNMTREFCNNVYGSVLGMRIIQNGLLAYALCQHWGNAPEQFEKQPLSAAANPAGVTLLNMFDNAQKYADIAETPFLKTVLGLHVPAKLEAQKPYAVYHDVGARAQTAGGWVDSLSLLYHYSLEAKAYQVIVTDSRTWRSFPLPGKTAPPDLIAQAQLSFQIGKTPELGNRLLLIVVTTNMPPGPTIRQGARDLPTIVQLDGAKHWYDEFYDSWDITRVNYARMLAEISRKFKPNTENVRSGGLVLLSGDVHSSSASRITYSAVEQVGDVSGAPTGAELSIAQLIGSSLHNQSADTIGQHTTGYSYVPPVRKFKVNVSEALKQPIKLIEGFVGWNPVTTTAFLNVGTFTEFVGEDSNERDLKFDPNLCTVTLRDEILPSADARMPYLWEKRLDRITKKPHYQIRLDYLKVTKTGRYKYEPKVIESSNDALRLSSERAHAYEDYIHSVNSGSQMVGFNNIGEITFIRNLPRQNGSGFTDLSTRYIVHWQEKGMVQFVFYDLSLDVSDPTYPQVSYPAKKV